MLGPKSLYFVGLALHSSTTGQFRGKVSLVQTSMSMFLSSMKCLYTLLCSLIEYTMFHEVYLHYTLYTN